MSIPDESHPGWLKAISGKGAFEFECLATKVILGCLHQSYKRDESPHTVKKCITELRAYFEKNSKLPKVQNDLTKIIGGR